MSDDLTKQFEEVKRLRKRKKRTSYSRNMSKLDEYRDEILTKHQEDESLETIRVWLEEHKNIRAVRSTILRRIKLWIEGER